SERSAHGRATEGIPRSRRLLATAHALDPRDSDRETEGLRLPADPVHLPAAEDQGGSARAAHVPRIESDAPAPRVPRPHVRLPLQARLHRPPARVRSPRLPP